MTKVKNFFSGKKIILIVLAVSAVAFFLYNQNVQMNKEEASNSTTVKQGTLAETLILSGEIRPKESTNLKFQTAGRLAKLTVSNGDIVQKGQLIASLDQRDLRKRLSKELNDFNTARWNFDQNVDDTKDKAVTTAMQRILDKSQFDLNNAVIDVEIQSISLEFSNLFAPVQGIVVDAGTIRPGVNITAADSIVKIINPDSLYFEVTADQTEVTKILPNMKGTLTFDAYAEEPIDGVIATIGFTPKEGESGTVYAVEISYGNSSNQALKYKVGMTGDIEFVISEKSNVLHVPIEFVQDAEDGKKFVFVMENGKKVERSVKTGMETDTDVEIISGLSKGEVIYD